MLRQAVSRLSRVWIPTGGIAAPGVEDGHSKLIRAGFLRQSYPGVFSMLPLGRRVQDKTERLVEKHMEESLAASRVSLSSISAESLWDKSGRLQNVASELFRFTDRRQVPYLLSPTHEEEITSLVARTVRSHNELPLRLYQITRKYRDEFRPRHGLLRGREFTMKDLYTFDVSLASALETYDQVSRAYASIFREMGLPVLAARASSGDMGGDLSHEYLLPTPLGEDRVASCDGCDYVVNEEIADTATVPQVSATTPAGVWRGITKDRSTLVNVWYPKSSGDAFSGSLLEYTDADVNISAVKSVVPDLDAGVEDPLLFWVAATMGASLPQATTLVNIVDSRLPSSFTTELTTENTILPVWPADIGSPRPSLPVLVHGGHDGEDSRPLNLLRVHTGDKCPRCPSGSLRVQKALELGHTFHLGTRYSDPLEALITVPPTTGSVQSSQLPGSGPAGTNSRRVPIQMGCHGIGISRIIGAVAEHLADERGLNWPVSIAPYSCVVIPGHNVGEDEALGVYHDINTAASARSEYLDLIIDDRQKSLPWKLTDADLVGFPVLVVLGREWHSTGRAEIQCRRLGVKQLVGAGDLSRVVNELHASLQDSCGIV